MFHRTKDVLRTLTKKAPAKVDDYREGGPLGREAMAVTFNNSQHFLDVCGLRWNMFVEHRTERNEHSITVTVSDPDPRTSDSTYFQFKTIKNSKYLPTELVRLWRRKLTIEAMRMVYPTGILLSINPEEHSIAVGVPRVER